MKKIEVRFGDQDLKAAYDKLKSGRGDEQEVYRLISKAIDKLEENPFIGIRIPKKLIPSYYIKEYSVNNLHKVDLNKSWRLIYTIVGTDVLIVSVILEWMDHKKYERRFKY